MMRRYVEAERVRLGEDGAGGRPARVVEAIYLGQRVVVMAPRPSRVVATYDVPLAHPRTIEMRTGPEMAHLRNEIWDLVRGGVA